MNLLVASSQPYFPLAAGNWLDPGWEEIITGRAERMPASRKLNQNCGDQWEATADDLKLNLKGVPQSGSP